MKLINLFVLRGEVAPFCVSCDEPLSMEHTLLFCLDLTDIREKYFNIDSLKMLFKEVSSDIIFNFKKNIDISYYKFLAKNIHLMLILNYLIV